jgi:hypothetical protein
MITLVNESIDPTGASLFRLPDLNLAHKAFRISSRTPVVVELESASLNNITFFIQGNVTLRITQSVELIDIRVLSERKVPGFPTFELIEADGQHLVIGTESKIFEGLFRATRSELETCSVHAQEVQLESVRIVKTIVDASILSGTDGFFTDTVIAFRDAILSAIMLYRVEIPRCGSLTTVSSTIETTRISACTGSPFRSYSTDMIDVSLNGSIEIDQGVWQKVRFGIQEATSVVGWDFELTEATVCDKSRSFRIGGNPLLSCIRCDTESIHEPDAVCLLPGTHPAIKGQNCSAFLQPSDCPEPFPQRTRP